MSDFEQAREDARVARVERAKDLVRMSMALIRAETEGTPRGEVVLTWSVGPRMGQRVARNTLWRLRSLLGLVSGRLGDKRTGRRDSKAKLMEVRP